MNGLGMMLFVKTIKLLQEHQMLVHKLTQMMLKPLELSIYTQLKPTSYYIVIKYFLLNIYNFFFLFLQVLCLMYHKLNLGILYLIINNHKCLRLVLLLYQLEVHFGLGEYLYTISLMYYSHKARSLIQPLMLNSINQH